jgi:hypothetical protein
MKAVRIWFCFKDICVIFIFLKWAVVFCILGYIMGFLSSSSSSSFFLYFFF